MAVERGCGYREPGGVYAVTPLVARGHAIEHFLLDPAVPVAQVLGAPDALPNRGVLVQPMADGVHHVFDKVGSKHYPNVLDFVEETRRAGLSRRLPAGPGLANLCERSLIFLGHERAVILNASDYYQALQQELADYAGSAGLRCPRQMHQLDDLVATNDYRTCAGLWWEDVAGGDELFDPAAAPRTVQRGMPGHEPVWSYRAQRRPDTCKPQYEAGFFLRLPIAKLEVIYDESGGTHEDAVVLAQRSSLPVELADA
jgi:hypothetical protein